MQAAHGHRIKSRSEQLVEQRHGMPVEVLLRQLYVTDGLPQDEVARVLGVGRKAVIRWMAEFGIPARDRRKVAA